jgi:hypothetical protein
MNTFAAIPDDIKKIITDLINTVSNLEKRIFCLESENRDLRASIDETQVLLLKTHKRTMDIENIFFAKDEDGEIITDYEGKPVISHGLNINNDNTMELNNPIPETTLDLKACAVVEHLKEEVKANEFGLYTIDKKELDTFMTEKIDKDLRVKKVSRQLKKDIFRRAIELFSDIVCIRTSPSGNKTKTLTLKQSVKRTNTDSPTRLAGIGIWG